MRYVRKANAEAQAHAQAMAFGIAYHVEKVSGYRPGSTAWAVVATRAKDGSFVPFDPETDAKG